MHPNIFRHISTNILSCRIKKKKKDEIAISTMKTNQMSTMWQYLNSIKLSFSNQNLQNDIVIPRLQYFNESCIILKLIWTILAYNQN